MGYKHTQVTLMRSSLWVQILPQSHLCVVEHGVQTYPSLTYA